MTNIHQIIGEFIIGLVRLLVLLTGGFLTIIVRLWRWIKRLLRSENFFEEEQEDPCGKLPEAIVRRPDPCLYSQELLMAQGLPVTWNNPDIDIAPASDPTNVLPDSYHLEADTDYIVFVRVSNASATDPAIGTRVRLLYRPWSFNSPDRVPVETDASGNEVARFANVPPMSSDVVEFHWHTPQLAAGESHKHFCLQATVDHPMDTNVSNNLGQENTNVYQSENPGPPRPGEEIALTVPLFNPDEDDRRVVFETNAYALDEEDRSYRLSLQTTRGYAYDRESLIDRLATLQPIVQGSARPLASEAVVSRGIQARIPSFSDQLRLHPRSTIVAEKHRYTGYETIREDILAEDHSLPDGMRITIDGERPREGVWIDAEEERDVRVEIAIPEDITPGTSIPVNVTARDQGELPLGGVTVILSIEEEE